MYGDEDTRPLYNLAANRRYHSCACATIVTEAGQGIQVISGFYFQCFVLYSLKTFPRLGKFASVKHYSPSPVVSLQTLYQRKPETPRYSSLPFHFHMVLLRGLVEKTVVRPFSPGGSVQFSFLLWIPISIGQAR